jgi:sugar transferase (PEP-CTERM/EpsH1 system associated)
MLDYYRHAPLQRWIAGLVARERIDLVYIFSTAMAPYALDLPALRAVPTILDMVDVDSEKWADYARKTSGPARLVWAREARTLRTYERRATAACARTLLVTDAECRCLVARAPESAAKILALENGVDLDFFAPAGDAVATPYPAAGPWLTLVGNFDYWPNQDAAIWFARDVLPRLRTGRGPGGSATAKLALVGANPSRSILDLAAPDVLVTGRVADIRPWLAHAAAVVAPLRIARGVQNKVLEAMAAGRPVVASPQACLGIAAEPGRDLLVADGAAEMAGRIAEVLDGQHPGLGAAGRQAVQRYAWPLRLAQLDAILADLRPDLAVR